MAPLRSLLVLLTVLGLVCAATAVAQAPVEWYTEDAGGGAVAGPAPHLGGGGAIAPLDPGRPATVNLPPPTDVTPSDSPPAQPARVPASEPQDPQSPPADRPAAAKAASTPAKAAAAPAADPGPLPFTGLELAVIAAAGLCLLAGGLALRPRAAHR